MDTGAFLIGNAIFWLVALVAFIVVESVTYGLVSIWFAAGAVAALVMCMLGFGVLAQTVAFTIVSAILILVVRPFAKRFAGSRKVRTNADRVIGNEGVVIKEINPILGVGQVKVMGQIWSARPADGESVIAAEKRVVVTGIAGVKVTVKEI